MGALGQLSFFLHEPGRVEVASLTECNALLEVHHYLGPSSISELALGLWDEDQRLRQCQVWKYPTARLVPQEWFELARWCIAPGSGPNAGSKFHGQAIRLLRSLRPELQTLVSYSDMTKHNGALYRACNWEEAPTHHAERFRANGVGYPSGHGSWDGVTRQEPKLRWLFNLT